jgi:translation initiation factor IF-3
LIISSVSQPSRPGQSGSNRNSPYQKDSGGILHRVNEKIRSKQVRLIETKDGEDINIGVVDTQEALRRAKEAGLDLVEISPNVDPPVAKILNYGKFKYEQGKKKSAAKKNQKKVKLKEIKFRPGTDVGDYQVKLRNLKSFLAAGNKVKISVWFRGREMMHQDLGKKLLERILVDMTDQAKVEFFPKLEGRQMTMILAPLRA